MAISKIEELHKLYLKNRGVSIDTRTLKEGDLFFALSGPNFDGNQYAQRAIDAGAIAVVVDDGELEGVKSGDDRFILVADTLSTLQSIARFHRDQSDAKVISITGSNGKTTTKELLAAVLNIQYEIIFTKGNLNNHIGVPLTLLSIKENTKIAIVEMGANHIGEIAELCTIAKPDYGFITNIGKAHIEGFGSLEGIIEGKGELYRAIEASGGQLFVNESDQILVDLANGYGSITYFSSEKSFENTSVENHEVDGFLEISFQWKGVQCREKCHLYGEYNFQNILAALNLGYFFQVAPPDALKAIASYIPQNSRSQRITTKSNEIYLDAYNANPTSMEHALRAFAKVNGDSKVVILGDMFELGVESSELHHDIADLANELFDDVILVGENFYKVSSDQTKYRTTSDLKNYLSTKSMYNKTILLKGSRGMSLEELLEEL